MPRPGIDYIRAVNGGSSHGPVRTTRESKLVEEWALVLNARGIPFELDVSDGEIRLWTLPGDMERAARELDAFDVENVPEAPRPEVPRYGASSLGIAIAWLILAAHGLMADAPILRERGSADAERVLWGEPWRAVTALTLHADLPHALGNAAFGGALLTAAAWRVGPGLALAITVAAGIAGNVLTAALYATRHDAIGASTAVFGTLGLVTATALFDARRFRVRRRAPWVLIGASLALLGFLGANEGSDVIAHAAGWLFGILFGMVAIVAAPAPPRGRWQWSLLIASTVILLGSWGLALR